MRGLRAAKELGSSGGVGQIERFASYADSLQPGRARPLERDIVVRIEAVDGDHVGSVESESMGNVHADKAGCARHEHPHDRRPFADCSSARSFAYFEKLLKQPIAV